jgi:hypothetical protein
MDPEEATKDITSFKAYVDSIKLLERRLDGFTNLWEINQRPRDSLFVAKDAYRDGYIQGLADAEAIKNGETK